MMGWVRRLFQRFGRSVPGVTETPNPPTTRRVVEAGYPPTREESGYRLIRGGLYQFYRDLPPLDHDKHQRLAHYLWLSHPLVRRAVQIGRRDLVLGGGFVLQAKESQWQKRVQESLDYFWRLNWQSQLPVRVETLGVLGEWIYHCPTPQPHTGYFELGGILPENVREVVLCPTNCEQVLSVILKSPVKVWTPDGWREQQEFSVLRQDWRTGRISGEVLYLGVNRLSGSARGTSDLLPVIDWVDILDQAQFTETERWQLARNLVYRCRVRGSQSKVEEVRDYYRQNPLRPGSVLVHNEEEEWEVLTPNLGLAESTQFIRWLFLFCWGGLGLPEHFYAEANTVNRASAVEMAEPVFAFVRLRRQVIIDFIRLSAQYWLQCVSEHGALRDIPAEALDFEVVSQDPDRTKYDVIGTMLKSVGDSLAQAEEAGWLSPQEAAMAYRMVARSLGLGEFSPEVALDLDGERTRAEQALQWQRPLLQGAAV